MDENQPKESERKKRKRGEPPTLKELGVYLAKIDRHIIALLARRTELVLLVEERKKIEGIPILRKGTEEQRLEKIKEWAKEKGIDPNFAQALLYIIIAESCRAQIEQLQKRTLEVPSEEDGLFEADRAQWYACLKNNLLTLTAEIAPFYDQQYSDKAPFATRSYLAFETILLKKEMDTLKALGNLNLAVDLGCATGRITFMLAPHFQRVIGYDISPAMIKQAQMKAQSNNVKNAEFVTLDFEKGIPLQDNSVSLVIMNLGTASDVMYLRQILAGIARILKKDGRFLLSFYNAAALFYHADIIPWQVSLIAEINTAKNCLDVHFDTRVFRIFAHPYTPREVKDLIQNVGLRISFLATYPTVASILPDEFFSGEEVKNSIEKIDHKLVEMEKGAYILVTGRKI